MTLPPASGPSEWQGRVARAVRVRSRSTLTRDPEPRGITWHLGPTVSRRPPMFLLEPALPDASTAHLDARCLFDDNGQRIVNMVRLSFGDVDRSLALELMPYPVPRSLHLEVWCPADRPEPDDDVPDWDWYSVWDVAPVLSRWQRCSATGVGYWEFAGAVRRPLRAMIPWGTTGEVPLFGVLRTPEALPAPSLLPR